MRARLRVSGARRSAGSSSCSSEIAGRLDAREADQGPHLAQPLRQDDLLEQACVAAGGGDRHQPEVAELRAGSRVAEDLPTPAP